MKLLLLLIMSPVLWGAATFTSTQTGNWNDPTTWGFSAGTCVYHTTCPAMTDSGDAGDKVLLGNLAHTVTCPSGVTCSAGTSPSTNDQSNPAIGAVSYTNTTAVLAIAGNLIYAGAVFHNNSAWTFAAGSTVTHDSSWSVAPTTAGYGWGLNHSASGTGGRNTYNGTSGSHVTWEGAGNSAANASCNNFACRSGDIGRSGDANNADHGLTTCSYTDFNHVGRTGANLAIEIRINVGNSSFDHCNLNASNTFYINESTGAGTLSITGMKITNPIQTGGSTGAIGISPALASGARSITNSIIEGTIAVVNVGGTGTNFVFRGIVFKDATMGIGFYQGQSVSASRYSTDQILMRHQATTDTSGQVPPGTNTSWVWARYVNSAQFNQHPIGLATGAGASVRKFFIEGNLPNDASDMIGPGPNGAGSLFIENNVMACKQDGTTLGSFVNTSAGTTSGNTIYVRNNSWCSGGSNPATDVLVMGVGWEAADQIAGAYSAITNNLAYKLNSLGTVELSCVQVDGAGHTAAAGVVTLLGYNATFNDNGTTSYCAPTLANSHIASGPTADLRYGRAPVFLDETLTSFRRMLNFDTKYLGNAVSSTTWATGQTYTVGQVVSDIQSTVYSSAALNWRVISVAGGCATSASTNRPMTGSAWVGCWEPAAELVIETSLLAGTTYTDVFGTTGVTIIGALNAWARQGHTPIEPTLLTAGNGGTFIGAMQPQSNNVRRPVWLFR